MLTIIDPRTGAAFPSAIVGGRACFAVPFGRAFAVKVSPTGYVRSEAVIAVDGRDTQTNQPASPAMPGIVITSDYTCPGFQTGEGTAAEFVHMPKGQGLTTAERNGTADSCGLVAAVLFSEQRRRQPSHLESFGGPVMRGGPSGQMVSRSSGGAMAGADVSNRLGQTSWERGEKIAEEVIEYDTRDGWAARGVVIHEVSSGNPWPGAAPKFAARSAL
jgi:hypothetical protein